MVIDIRQREARELKTCSRCGCTYADPGQLVKVVDNGTVHIELGQCVAYLKSERNRLVGIISNVSYCMGQGELRAEDI